MPPRISLSILAAVLMGFLAVVPLGYPEAVNSLGWRVGALVVFVAGIATLFVQGILQAREEQRNRAAQARQAEALDQLAEAIRAQRTVITGTGAIALQRLTVRATGRVSTLADKAEELARDLLGFLKEKGPIPEQPPMRGPNDKWNRFWEVKHPLEQRIDAGYSAHFADSVSKTRHQIQENGVNTHMLDELVDKKYHDSDTIREIAAVLLEMSVRMRTADLLKDATTSG